MHKINANLKTKWRVLMIKSANYLIKDHFILLHKMIKKNRKKTCILLKLSSIKRRENRSNYQKVLHFKNQTNLSVPTTRKFSVKASLLILLLLNNFVFLFVNLSEIMSIIDSFLLKISLKALSMINFS